MIALTYLLAVLVGVGALTVTLLRHHPAPRAREGRGTGPLVIETTAGTEIRIVVTGLAA